MSKNESHTLERRSLEKAMLWTIGTGNYQASDTLYEMASDEIAKKKLIQVALKTMFRLREGVPDKDMIVKIATIDELKKSGFKDWFEVGNK